MDKVKIKRVKRAKKKTSTKEKVLAGLGLGSTLLGGASVVQPPQKTTQFVRTQEAGQTTKKGKIKEKLKRVFGVPQAKAMAAAEDDESLYESYAGGGQAALDSGAPIAETAPEAPADTAPATTYTPPPAPVSASVDESLPSPADNTVTEPDTSGANVVPIPPASTAVEETVSNPVDTSVPQPDTYDASGGYTSPSYSTDQTRSAEEDTTSSYTSAPQHMDIRTINGYEEFFDGPTGTWKIMNGASRDTSLGYREVWSEQLQRWHPENLSVRSASQGYDEYYNAIVHQWLPVDGAVKTVNGQTYDWNGSAWIERQTETPTEPVTPTSPYTDEQLLAGINSLSWNDSIPPSQLQRISDRIVIPEQVTPGTVLAFMLGLGDGSDGITSRPGNDGKAYELVNGMWTAKQETTEPPPVQPAPNFGDGITFSNLNDATFRYTVNQMPDGGLEIKFTDTKTGEPVTIQAKTREELLGITQTYNTREYRPEYGALISVGNDWYRLTQGDYIQINTSGREVYRDESGNAAAYFGEVGGTRVYYVGATGQLIRENADGAYTDITADLSISQYTKDAMVQALSGLYPSVDSQNKIVSITGRSLLSEIGVGTDKSSPATEVERNTYTTGDGYSFSQINTRMPLGEVTYQSDVVRDPQTQQVTSVTITLLDSQGNPVKDSSGQVVSRTLMGNDIYSYLRDNSANFTSMSRTEQMVFAAVSDLPGRITGIPYTPAPESGTPNGITMGPTDVRLVTRSDGSTLNTYNPNYVSTPEEAAFFQKMFPGSTIRVQEFGDLYSRMEYYDDRHRIYELVMPDGTVRNVGGLRTSYERYGLDPDNPLSIAAIEGVVTDWIQAPTGGISLGGDYVTTPPPSGVMVDENTPAPEVKPLTYNAEGTSLDKSVAFGDQTLNYQVIDNKDGTFSVLYNGKVLMQGSTRADLEAARTKWPSMVATPEGMILSNLSFGYDNVFVSQDGTTMIDEGIRPAIDTAASHEVWRDQYGNSASYFGELSGRVYYDAATKRLYQELPDGSIRDITSDNTVLSPEQRQNLLNILTANAGGSITIKGYEAGYNLLTELGVGIQKGGEYHPEQSYIEPSAYVSSSWSGVTSYQTALKQPFTIDVATDPSGNRFYTFTTTLDGKTVTRTFNGAEDLNNFLERSFISTNSFEALSPEDRLIAAAAINSRIKYPEIGLGIPRLPSPATDHSSTIKYQQEDGTWVTVTNGYNPQMLSSLEEAEYYQKLFPGSTISDNGRLSSPITNFPGETINIDPNDPRRFYELVMPDGSRHSVAAIRNHSVYSNGFVIMNVSPSAVQYFQAPEGSNIKLSQSSLEAVEEAAEARVFAEASVVELTGLSTTTASPGQRIEIYGNGFTAPADKYAIELGRDNGSPFIIPATENIDGGVAFVLPPPGYIAAQDWQVRVFRNDTSPTIMSNALTLTVTAAQQTVTTRSGATAANIETSPLADQQSVSGVAGTGTVNLGAPPVSRQSVGQSDMGTTAAQDGVRVNYYNAASTAGSTNNRSYQSPAGSNAPGGSMETYGAAESAANFQGLKMPPGYPASSGTIQQSPEGLKMPPGYPASDGLKMPPGYPASEAGLQVRGASVGETIGTYKVKKGDTLWSIAKRHYGDGKKWRKILEANTSKVKNPKTLQIGTELVIPKL